MKIFNSLEEIQRHKAQSLRVTDSVHRGHQEIIKNGEGAEASRP